MAEAREATLGVVVGKKGVGKTYTTTDIIKRYAAGGNAMSRPRKVLILDVNDEFGDVAKPIAIKDISLFTRHPKVEIRRIRPINANGKKMTLNEIADTLFIILEVYRGGLLLIEDINKYVSDSLPNDLVGAICTNRHADLDIIMHYQSIGRITPKIWQNINWLRFHKNTDSVDRHKNKFEDKYHYLSIAENIVNFRYVQKDDKRFYLMVSIDDEKISGNFTKLEFTRASLEYVTTNLSQILKREMGKFQLKNNFAKINVEEMRKHIINEEVSKLVKEHSAFSTDDIPRFVHESLKLF
jgi:hypothetical protein